MSLTKTIIVSANKAWYLYNFRRNIANVLSKKYNITFLASDDGYGDRLQNHGSYVNFNHRNKTLNPLVILYELIQYFKLVLRIKPSLILSYTPKINYFNLVISKILGIPVIINVSGIGYFELKHPVLHWSFVLIRRVLFTNADYVVFQNRENLKYFIEKKIVLVSKSVLVPGSGVDLSIFRFHEESSTLQKPFKFLFVGRLIEKKGIVDFINAAKLISSSKYRMLVKCQVLGQIYTDNPTSISSEEIAQVHSEGIVEYLGMTDDVAQIMGQANIVVLPTKYNEGIPRTLIEAGAMGKPVITTDNVGCREIIIDGFNGFYCKKNDPNDLYKKMVAMIEMEPKKRMEMGRNGRKKVEQEFDEKIVIDKYLEIIEEILF